MILSFFIKLAQQWVKKFFYSGMHPTHRRGKLCSVHDRIQKSAGLWLLVIRNIQVKEWIRFEEKKKWGFTKPKILTLPCHAYPGVTIFLTSWKNETVKPKLNSKLYEGSEWVGILKQIQVKISWYTCFNVFFYIGYKWFWAF